MNPPALAGIASCPIYPSSAAPMLCPKAVVLGALLTTETLGFAFVSGPPVSGFRSSAAVRIGASIGRRPTPSEQQPQQFLNAGLGIRGGETRRASSVSESGVDGGGGGDGTNSARCVYITTTFIFARPPVSCLRIMFRRQEFHKRVHFFL